MEVGGEGESFSGDLKALSMAGKRSDPSKLTFKLV